jgi:hypothetical protein
MKKSDIWYGGKPCKSCKGDNQPYMLTSDLWKIVAAPKERRSFLCIPCVEKRLGRKLTLEDFNNAPLNYGSCGFDCYEYVTGTPLSVMKYRYDSIMLNYMQILEEAKDPWHY